MNEPILSIVIPTKNRVDCVNALAADLVSSAGFNSNIVDILVLDNATPNPSYSLPSTVRLHRHLSDIGAIKNILAAAHTAKGKYVWILGDDDSLREDIFECLFKLIREYSPSLIRLRHEYAETNDILRSFKSSRLDTYEPDSTSNKLFDFKSYDLAGIKSFEDKAGFISVNIFEREVLSMALSICRGIAPLCVYENNVYITKLYAAVALYLSGGYWESREVIVKQRVPQIGRNFMDTAVDWFRNFVEAPAEIYRCCSSLNPDLAKVLLKTHYAKNVDFNYAASNGVPFLRSASYILKGLKSSGMRVSMGSSVKCLKAYIKN